VVVVAAARIRAGWHSDEAIHSLESKIATKTLSSAVVVAAGTRAGAAMPSPSTIA
jgi:hypothetical protein